AALPTPHTGLRAWGAGAASSAAAVTETSGSGSATATHSYATPGVYTLTVTGTDSRGGAGMGTLQFRLLPGTTIPIRHRVAVASTALEVARGGRVWPRVFACGF